jgi:hypothetical protein
MSNDRLLRSIGFLSSPKIHKALTKASLPTIRIEHVDRNPTIDPGEIASLRAADRTTEPSPLPPKAGDLYHCDIGFGPTRAIGGAFYTLLLVDKRTSHAFIYPLKNLKEDLHIQFKQFLVDVEGNCRAIRTDFDHKIIGGAVRKFLRDETISVTAAPPRQQHKNGLVERKYQTILQMARNWLTNSLLPSNYWWLAMKRAVEVSNMLPTFHIKTDPPTTPHEYFYGSQPDLRALVPMFTVAYVTRPSLSKFHSNALKCICVGRCSVSNGLLFYHPTTKQLFTEGNTVRFDLTLAAGPCFNEPYDGSFSYTSQADLDNILHRPSPFSTNNTVFAPHPNTTIITAAKVISTPVDPTSTPYTIRFTDGLISEHMADDLLDHDPTATRIDAPSTTANPALPWLLHDAKCTLSHPALGPRPKWGYLQFDDSSSNADDAWSFICGKNKTGTTVQLPKFREKAHDLLT